MKCTKSQTAVKNRKPPIARIEPLEDRRLMSVSFGTNLILNPGAESNTGASNTSGIVHPSNWTVNGNPTAVKYGATGGFPTSATPGPASRGANFFAGGPSGESDLFQTIDVSSISAFTDSKSVSFTLAGYLGGNTSQLDNATVFVNFQNSSHSFISQSSIGPVTAANRGNKTELLSKSLTAALPTSTRFVQVQIHFDPISGGYNDAYADNLSLTLATTSGAITGTVFNDANGNKTKDSGEVGLAGVVVYLDFNNNGQLDSFELKTTTDSSGHFTFTVPFGTYVIRQVVPANFKQTTTAASFTINLAKGATNSTSLFGDKHL